MAEETKLSFDVVCPNCSTEVEIDEEEQKAGRFECPNCQQAITEFESTQSRSPDSGALEGVAGWLKLFVVVRIYLDPIIS